jgi:hypothetical protein
MQPFPAAYRERIRQEAGETPDEYLPMLLQIVRSFRQSVALKPADGSFRQGWAEVRAGETLPVSELWTGLDVDKVQRAIHENDSNTVCAVNLDHVQTVRRTEVGATVTVLSTERMREVEQALCFALGMDRFLPAEG